MCHFAIHRWFIAWGALSIGSGAFATAQERQSVDISARIEARQLELRDGQVVRPQGAGRATVVIDSSGWTIEAQSLEFRSLDFVGERSTAEGNRAVSVAPALITLTGARVTFVDCSFQGTADLPVVALRWAPRLAEADAISELALHACRLRSVAAGIDASPRGQMTLDLQDTLHTGPGPLVSLAALPSVGQTLALTCEHLTVRGGRGLLATSHDLHEPLGRLAVHAIECVFAPQRNAPVIAVSTRVDPAEWLTSLVWTGQGSVLLPETPLLVWRDALGHHHRIAENMVRASGLVRSDVRFVGAEDHSPANSLLSDWTVPIRSLSPPGITDRHQPMAPQILPASGVQ